MAIVILSGPYFISPVICFNNMSVLMSWLGEKEVEVVTLDEFGNCQEMPTAHITFTMSVIQLDGRPCTFQDIINLFFWPALRWTLCVCMCVHMHVCPCTSLCVPLRQYLITQPRMIRYLIKIALNTCLDLPRARDLSLGLICVYTCAYEHEMLISPVPLSVVTKIWKKNEQWSLRWLGSNGNKDSESFSVFKLIVYVLGTKKG